MICLPRLSGAPTLLVLSPPAAAQQVDHDGCQQMAALGTFRLGWPEHHPDAVGVHTRPGDGSDAGVEVEVRPGQAEDLRHAPALHEQQCNRGAETVVRAGSYDGPSLGSRERPPCRCPCLRWAYTVDWVRRDQTEVDRLFHD